MNSSSPLNNLLIDNKVVLWLGFIVFILGLLLALWARINIGRNWGVPMSQKEKPELVTSGPYSFIRHPIYSGLLLAVIGCVLASSLYWLVLLAIQASYFIYAATVEEKIMMKEFPNIYPKYKSKTKMLIPFIF